MNQPEIPGYTVEREIGAGGMARVYLATQNSLDRRVAMKVMAPALVADPSFSKRFMLEARTLAGLTHPNIVAVYDVGATDQLLHYFAMQYLDNGDLAMRIRRGIPEVELVRVVTAIAKALGFAHTRGVVHRDVTPGNIMFDAANNPVLTDCGIARSQHGASRITQTGVSIGTSSYMSPEQARGGEVDRRSDLYSLGVLLFECLTGHPPYQGVDGFAVAYAHVFEPVPRFPNHLQHWQLFIDKVLAKDPNERFDTAEQFVVALSDVPVLATRIVPQKVIAGQNATRNMAQLKPDTPLPGHVSAPTAAIATVSPQNVEKIKQQLGSAPKAPAKTEYRPATAGQSQIEGSGNRRGLWLSLAGLAALVLAGGGYWLQKRNQGFDPVVAAEDKATATAPITVGGSEDQVAKAPSASSSENPLPVEPTVQSVPIDAVARDPALDPVELDPAALDPAALDPTLNPNNPETIPPGDPLPTQFGPPTRAQWAAPIVAWGQTLAGRQQCFTPAGAIRQFRWALSEDRSNALAIQGIAGCFALAKAKTDAYLGSNTQDAKALNTELNVMLTIAKVGGAQSKEALAVQAELQRAIALHNEQGETANQDWRPQAAIAQFKNTLVFDASNNAAMKGIAFAEKLGQPGYVFRNEAPGGRGPAMVIVKNGKVGLKDARGAGPSVSIPSFAVSQFEVTVGEYRAFTQQSGYAGNGKGCNNIEGLAMFVSRDRNWKNPGFEQTDSSPVTCVNAIDADRYVTWLNKKNQGVYRLLSEAEWQYLAQSAPAPRCKAGNLADQDFGKVFEKSKVLGCSDGAGGTASVGKFGRDSNGVSDLTGNVREWIGDCWNASLAGRPNSREAWKAGNCAQRIAMGTSFVSGADETKAAIRNNFDSDDLNNTVGFRVARDLPKSLNESQTETPKE